VKTIRKGLIKRIHINGALLRQSKQGRKAVKPISIQTSKGAKIARSVLVDGPSHLVFSPDKRLSSGAVLWIETKAEVKYE
jgi:hypothetical protein